MVHKIDVCHYQRFIGVFLKMICKYVCLLKKQKVIILREEPLSRCVVLIAIYEKS